MVNKIKRDTETYREIEAFGDYELTNCCMYEMAIRSLWFENELQSIIDLYEDYNPNKEDIIEIDENVCKNILTPSTFSTILDKILKLGIQTRMEYPLNQSEKAKTVAKIYNTLKSIGETRVSEVTSDTIIMRIEAERKTHITRFLSFPYCHIEQRFAIDEWLIKDDIRPGIFEGEGTIKAKEILKDLIDDDLINLVDKQIAISPNFSRPKLSLGDITGLNVAMNLDFSLPKHELLEYISLVKDCVDNDPALISPTILLDKELADIFKFALLESKKGQKQIKLATMFYIYDAFKAGMKQSQIKQEVSYYNGSNIDERTIKDYHSIMKTLIDEGNCKFLTHFITF